MSRRQLASGTFVHLGMSYEGPARVLPSRTLDLYRAWEATTKFGTGNMGGVIEVTTKTQ